MPRKSKVDVPGIFIISLPEESFGPGYLKDYNDRNDFPERVGSEEARGDNILIMCWKNKGIFF